MNVQAKVLRSFPFFRPLGDEELERLASYVREQRYRAAAIIFKDGDPGTTYYLVRSGRIQLLKTTAEEETLLGEMQAGDGFGEMSLLDDQPRSATARAAQDTTLLEIPKDQFLALVQRYPTLLFQTAHVSDERLRHRDRQWIRELEIRNRQLEKLYETSLSISRHLELQTALLEIIERAMQLLEGSKGSLHLYDPARNLLVALDSGETLRSEYRATGLAFRRGEVVTENRARGKRAGSILAAPICLGTGALGVLTIYRPPSKLPCTPRDAQLLLLLANQAAIAIESARLHRIELDKARLDGELHAARQVQESLIPHRAAHIPGFKVAALWRPAHEVSGDFYDFIPLSDHRWGLVIADVSDKGMPAALFMSASRSILRASANAELDAAAIIGRANRVLCADATNGMFVTLFFAILDPRARRLTYVNAGHNPPILLPARGQPPEYLTRTTLPLGVTTEMRITVQQVSLEENDVLVLYTDGVTEATNASGELYGEARLLELIRRQTRMGAVALTRAVDHSIREFTGQRSLADDITLVVLKTGAQG
jgi:serine phosphatase RsbU (regulator of sigma subunit)/CRP-like cAMP-binding protein